LFRFCPNLHAWAAYAPPSAFPIDANVSVDKGGQMVKKTAFYVRIGNGTREITDPAEKQRFIASRWSAPSQGG
jgi:hypothetical protein